MNINKLAFRNFKTLENVSFEPGRVNVFIGANGSGKTKKNSARSQAQIKRREHEKSSVRAKVEHVFAVVKLQLRFRKTRYRGLQKQIAKMNIMFALANLILADRPCLAA